MTSALYNHRGKPPYNRFHLTAFGAGTQAAWGKLSFWLLDVALPGPAAGEAQRWASWAVHARGCRGVTMRPITGVCLHGKYMRDFTRLALNRSGVEVTTCPWTRFPSFRLAGREVARFYSSRGLDLRLTRQVIVEGKALFAADPRIELRPSKSHWLRFNLRHSSDIAITLELFELALQANLAELLSDAEARSR